MSDGTPPDASGPPPEPGQPAQPGRARRIAEVDSRAADYVRRVRSSTFVELAQLATTLSILVVAYTYVAGRDAERAEQRKSRHYQAWQVVNSAAGKAGNGGRSDALRDLNADRVSLTYVDISGAWLPQVQLENANLFGADLDSATLIAANLRGADLAQAQLVGANLISATLVGADLAGAYLTGADLTCADLRGADLEGADLTGANLERANLAEIKGWQAITGLQDANLAGVRSPPAGFTARADSMGAVARELEYPCETTDRYLRLIQPETP
ncbi:MAG TPA: pentapeptide repeat-containing protein [Longimicrobiaceae bacterium]|nr:pentapeptide repeat-containing protein [Longimicrobiaceae bacterium]